MCNNDRIQKIKQRLSAATEGEWKLEGKEIWRRGDGYGGEYPKGHVWITDFTGSNMNNAVLIANAPFDLDYLLSEVERLQTENEAMKEALEYYAEGSEEGKLLWEPWERGNDGGTRARVVVSHLKG
ncbi:hypothetical protein [Paenibacillus macerans]|uniref:hypothetical protein n=1 Tax=Paenibacillus macerans TaxID=44252 RepID=UPI00203BDF6D|nr:hypothetical protein [Paenibacillus macerans]MCM3704034.1 hypothetical protein [Paenibacillus macerans]